MDDHRWFGGLSMERREEIQQFYQR